MLKKWLWLGVSVSLLMLYLMPTGAAPSAGANDSTQVVGKILGPADVKVVNGPNHPVPVVPQGTTQILGTVNVANFPPLQNIAGTVNIGNFPTVLPVSIIPEGSPVQLKGLDAAFSGNPIDKAFLDRRDGAGYGQRELQGRLAVSSLTITVDPSGTPGAVDIIVIAELCDGGFIGAIGPIWVKGGETVHLTYPTPVLLPDRGPQETFCVNAYVNDDDTAQFGSEFLVDIMGRLIPSASQ